jgi:hypothetical protein
MIEKRRDNRRALILGNIMTDERIAELVTQALDMSLFEPVTPSFVVESGGGAGRVEIPLAFARNFASLLLTENQ